MSNFGQAVLSIGGAVVGGMFGNPQLGYLIGSTLGNALFPTDLGTVSGPRLNDLAVQTSTVGAPIPIVYGTYALSGNMIWTSGIIETVSKKKQGGKGGPTQTVKTYTYKVNCAVGICEGVIEGVRRIWADAKLIVDLRPQLDGETDQEYADRQVASSLAMENIEIYYGTEDQLADPTIESFEGAGKISAFRGLAYAVFTDFQLADYGNRVPNFRFEVAGPRYSYTIGSYEPGYFPLMDVSARDPRLSSPGWDFNNTYGLNVTSVGPGDLGFSFVNSSGGTWSDTIAAALIASGHTALLPYTDTVQGWTFVNTMTLTGSIPEAYRKGHFPCAAEFNPQPFDSDGTIFFDFFFSALDGYATHCLDTGNGETLEDYMASNAGPVHIVTKDLTIPSHDPGIYVRVGYTDPNTIAGHPAELGPNSVTEDWKILYLPDTVLKARRSLIKPFAPCTYATETSEDGLWCRVNGLWVSVDADWTYNNSSLLFGLKVYQFAESGGIPYQCEIRPITDYQSGLVKGTFLPNGDPRNTQAFWEAEYAAAVADGDLPAGLVYGVDYPNYQMWWWAIEYTAYLALPNQTSLAEIVRDVCLRCGLTDDQIDVSDLGEAVDGYAITRVMSGRDAISPLRSFGFFDCVESAGVLKWPTRGKAAVAELTEDDLAAHVSDGGRPSAVEIVRAQEVELPRRLRVHYIQANNNYEPGEQGASRLAAGAEEFQDIELAVSMGDSKAAQVAEILLYTLWVERNVYKFYLSRRNMELEPADAITLPVEGRQERVRLTEIDFSIPGLMACTAVRDDDGQYVSYAIGAPNANSGTGGASMLIPGTAALKLLDIPMLADGDDDPGYYAGVYASGGNAWGGAALYRSADSGAIYDLVATIVDEVTHGTLDAALPTGPTTIIDEGSELLVTLSKDTFELESVGEPSLFAGYNAAAIGADDRWEIIQFRDAEFVSGTTWRLTGLLRGRKGTEWAIGLSQLGDDFVLLDSALVRVPLNASGIGAEYLHKVVLDGSALAVATAVAFTPQAVALEPYSVINITGTRDLAGDLTIEWDRRGRIGNELMSGTEIPLSEESESYVIDVLDGNSPSTVLRTLTSSTPSVVYVEADQVADFGSPVPGAVTVIVYQVSATVGRGYPSEATV